MSGRASGVKPVLNQTCRSMWRQLGEQGSNTKAPFILNESPFCNYDFVFYLPRKSDITVELSPLVKSKTGFILSFGTVEPFIRQCSILVHDAAVHSILLSKIGLKT